MDTKKEDVKQEQNVSESIRNSENITELEEINSQDDVINETLEQDNIKQNDTRKFVPYNPKAEKKTNDILAIFGILVLIFSTIVIMFTIIFLYSNNQNDKIFSGIHIKGIDVSNLTKEEAYEKIKNVIEELTPEEIKVKHIEYETSIATSNLNINFDIENAVNIAYNMGRDKNFFRNNLDIIKLKISNINIEPGISIDEEKLSDILNNISSNLPDKIIDSGCYIEDNNLIITKGKQGEVVDIEKTLEDIKNNIYNLELNNYIEISTKTQYPKSIDIDLIHKQVYKEAKDAYYTQNPFSVYPSENGLDFSIPIDEVKKMLQEEKEEYTIPLKTLYPKVTTNMIGTEAFPDLLSSFLTKYAVSDKNRTTNLILAANKINGKVVMPGEIFSYNQVVGARTIAAGYKEAPIYSEGKVVDGLGGGICQITSTLYNAVIYANLEIVERSNHQFVPSYVTASRDATVVYGAIDFKFKNNRSYPIKLVCSVSKGIASFQIFGLKSDNEYQVEISSRVTSTTSNSISSEAYKILKQNGQVVKTELLSRDVYKRH